MGNRFDFQLEKFGKRLSVAPAKDNMMSRCGSRKRCET